MDIYLACDHNANDQKEELRQAILPYGNVTDILDVSPGSDDYISMTAEVCSRINTTQVIGLLVCGTGIGVSIIANKHKGIIAARCLSAGDAEDCRVINQANVLCLSAKLPPHKNVEIIHSFFATPIVTNPKRIYRKVQIQNLEGRNFI